MKTTGGAKKRARYRWNWPQHIAHGTANDFTQGSTGADVLERAKAIRELLPVHYVDPGEHQRPASDLREDGQSVGRGVFPRRHDEGGAAVVYSTHYMEEVERICSRALLIDRGKVVAAGTVVVVVEVLSGPAVVEPLAGSQK